MQRWVYTFYGALVLVGGFFLFALSAYSLWSGQVYLPLIISLLVISVGCMLGGIRYLSLCGLTNTAIDLSIILGLVAIGLLVVFSGPVIIYEEVFGITLFPENYLIHMGVPVVVFFIAGFSLVCLLIGLFMPKRDVLKATKDGSVSGL